MSINHNPKSGVIYVMTDDVYSEHGYYKVGCTGRDIRKRLSEANVWNPKKSVHAVFAKRVDNPKQVEVKVLKALRDQQFGALKGEWFRGDIDKIVATIRDTLANH